MSKKVVLVADSGADIPVKYAEQYDITIVRMYVQRGNETDPDGTFPAEEVVKYYDEHGKCAKTSASTPYDFEVAFDKLHEENPDAGILYLAYSAVTTAAFQSAKIASEGRDYVRLVDTKHVSVGQCACVLRVARWLQDNPDADVDTAAKIAEQLCPETAMCFIPDNLDFLRAGGRVSNAAALLGGLLHIHPLVEILDGRLIVTTKLRGKMIKLAGKVIDEYTKRENLDKSWIGLICSPRLSESVKEEAEKAVEALGYMNHEWIETGCVITCHGGPGAFGIVGYKKK